jgi:RNA polymerase sigma factor (TIGR02999 family)
VTNWRFLIDTILLRSPQQDHELGIPAQQRLAGTFSKPVGILGPAVLVWTSIFLPGGMQLASTAVSVLNRVDGSLSVATDTLFSSLYFELHRLAKLELSRRGGQTRLGVTTLLHEAYLEIAGRENASFPDRARFMGYSARVMRGLIIDHVRSRAAIKRGSEFEITSLSTEIGHKPVNSRQLSLISDALDRLAKLEPELAEVVDLKFFCGFSFSEIGALQNLSERTVQRRWEKARIYLRLNISATLAM